jgi:hypothetical protein
MRLTGLDVIKNNGVHARRCTILTVASREVCQVLSFKRHSVRVARHATEGLGLDGSLGATRKTARAAWPLGRDAHVLALEALSLSFASTQTSDPETTNPAEARSVVHQILRSRLFDPITHTMMVMIQMAHAMSVCLSQRWRQDKKHDSSYNHYFCDIVHKYPCNNPQPFIWYGINDDVA